MLRTTNLKQLLEMIAKDLSKSYSSLIRSAGFHRSNITNIVSQKHPVTPEMLDKLYMNVICKHPNANNIMRALYNCIDKGNYGFRIAMTQTRASTKRRLIDAFKHLEHFEGVTEDIFNGTVRYIDVPDMWKGERRTQFVDAVFTAYDYSERRLNILKGIDRHDPELDSVGDIISDYLTVSNCSHEDFRERLGMNRNYYKRIVDDGKVYVCFVVDLIVKLHEESKCSVELHFEQFIDRLSAQVTSSSRIAVLMPHTVTVDSGVTLDFDVIYKSATGARKTEVRTHLSQREAALIMTYIMGSFSPMINPNITIEMVSDLVGKSMSAEALGESIYKLFGFRN